MMDPMPQFTTEDHSTWTKLFTAQARLRDRQIVPIFSQGLKILGIDEHKIPDLQVVNTKLTAMTGWQAIYSPGFVPPEEFFKMLSERRFPVGHFIRDSKDLNYTPAPDVFHDLYGHIPFLANKDYADFCQKIGKLGLKYLNQPAAIEALQRLFWFTAEFALIKTNKGIRIFGAGIASSISECEYALSEKPRVHAFNLKKIRNQSFRIDLIQEDLFILESEKQLYECLIDFESLL